MSTTEIAQKLHQWLRNPINLAHVIALYWLTVFNTTLWQHLYQIGLARGVAWGSVFAFAVILWGAFRLLLALGSWPGLFKVWSSLLTLLAASVAYFMAHYHVVIDQAMIRNVFETDQREALDLLNLNMLWWALVTFVLPVWGIWRLDLSWGKRPWLSSVFGTAWGLVAMVLAIMVQFDGISSLFRNHKEIRFMATPTNVVYYTARYWQEKFRHPPVFKQVAKNVALDKRWSDEQPPLIVFIAGETARRDHFSLNGYARQTNPELTMRQNSLINFDDVWSCGTDTAHSLPCMFGFLTRDQFDVETARYQENVLDVAKRAGYRVLWRDNSTGCKHICDRVAFQNYKEFGTRDKCSATSCYDEVLLNGLSDWINQANAPTLIVLHTIGSHGPSYYRRYPPNFAKFQPECRTNQLEKCSQQAVVNAYDNTILYTDFFINKVIEWVEQNYPNRPSMVFYVSDHGESLGENGVYLHGLPYFMAPDEQKRVPMIWWLSESFQRIHGVSRQCLAQSIKRRLTHDVVSHSLLGLMSIETDVYDSDLDVTAACRIGQ